MDRRIKARTLLCHDERMCQEVKVVPRVAQVAAQPTVRALCGVHNISKPPANAQIVSTAKPEK